MLWMLSICVGLAASVAWAEAAEDLRSAEPDAERLYRELEGSLFGAAPDSEVDEKLMEAIHEDLDSIEFDGDPKGEEKVDSIFGANPLTAGANPLLTESQRKRWLSTAIASVGYETVDKHLKKQAKSLKAGKVDRSEWYDHVARCTKICNPVVQGLLYEHVRQVASHPHLLLTFATGSADLAGHELRKLEQFVDAAAERGAQFLLIGRGSRTGNREFNRVLSARRVESVKASLQRSGVASDAVSGFWLGYEPPQISDEIARAYRLDEGLGDLQRNQSVMVVAYR
jgi:outer membrane protein OmpA-like peptidoglycan-associated protein